jgi:hypothetical protein
VLEEIVLGVSHLSRWCVRGVRPACGMVCGMKIESFTRSEIERERERDHYAHYAQPPPPPSRSRSFGNYFL